MLGNAESANTGPSNSGPVDGHAAQSNGSTVNSAAPTISLPTGGGAIRGIGEKFAANPATGTGSMSIPVYTSPGRSGFGPSLSLSYDSGSGNGPFGYGWSLSLPAITRKTDKGLPRYGDSTESDVFILSGAEDLVPVLEKDQDGNWVPGPDGNFLTAETTRDGYTIRPYRPRVEGLFARIERWTHQATGQVHWRSITRDNVTSLYGRTADSRVANPDGAGRIFSWLICESYDDRGNASVYEYAVENDSRVDRSQVSERNRARGANRYLKRVKYGNRVSRLVQPDLSQLQWLFEVVFDYDEDHYEPLELDPALTEAEQHRLVRAAAAAGQAWTVRPDPFSSHRAGFEVRTYRRCRRVLMFHRFDELGNEPYLVRSTEFDYNDLDPAQPATIEEELAHQGSTRFGSFLRAVTQSGYVRDETRPVVVRNGASYLTYVKKSLPPIEFEYTRASIQDEARELDAESLTNLPVGLDGGTYQWVDLDGEGLSGILSEQGGAWFYKRNLGGGHFGAQETVTLKPSLANLSGGRQQLLDLAGDGQLDLVVFAAPTPGFYERTEDAAWEPFRAFDHMPNVPWNDPNLQFVDLDGDGHADVLITEEDVFTWYPSLAEEGFAPGVRVHQALEEEQGPRLVMSDGTQSLYLADMSGDGLTDLVRIRNGEVCYWPNQGYGRFGPKVTMDNAPRFDRPDRFNRQRVRLADIDGSGLTDIIYLGKDSVRLYFNQSGNRWSAPRHMSQFPPVDNLASVTVADLLGNGTACLVWSSPLPGAAQQPVRYVDLMGGQKPHLLVKVTNNLGAETHIRFAPSTRFYLNDRLNGRPWLTRLPFPVHVVERVETYDRISGNRFVSRYAYHHGYFDGHEREFRGFGLVEQWDTEEFSALDASLPFPLGTNVEAASHVPPVLTRSWFHTGVYLGRGHVSDFFAGLLDGTDAGEYYREPGLSDAQARQHLLEDTVLPDGLTADEEREAARALRGLVLREEVYALDGTDKEQQPYTVTESNFAIRSLQPRSGNRHGVFFTHPRESITYNYERNPGDPRISHTLTLEVDEVGNVLKSVEVAYGRTQPDPDLQGPDQGMQTRRWVTYSENTVTNGIDTDDDYRTPVTSEARTYELTGHTSTGAAGRFRASDFVQPDPLDPTGRAQLHIFDGEVDYEDSPPAGRQRRLVEQVRTLFRSNNLTALLPPGTLESRALPGEVYKLAFTPGLLAQVYRRPREGQPPEDLLPTPASVLPVDLPGGQVADRGGYIDLDGDGRWWLPSGRSFFSPNTGHTPAQELSNARQHFFLAKRYRDPFGQTTTVTHDAYDLLLLETSDQLGNRTTVGERDAAGNLTAPGNDYRVLQPRLMMDSNRNRTAVALDVLGMVVGTAVMGKPGESLGDSLSGFQADLTEAVSLSHIADPLTGPHAILGRATTRLVYDLHAYRRTQSSPSPQPCVVYTLAREKHDSALAPGEQTRVQHRFSYSDGLGREVQKKIQAEPEKTNGVAGPPRWVGTGWTIFNNKGKPVRKYEPFFSATHRFEFARTVGVSPILFYDPLQRVVATLHPNHTYEKVVFDPWRQTTYDVNDTVTSDPRTDADIAGYVEAYFATQPSTWQTWRAARAGGALGPQEQAAANKAAAHANTPAITWLDTLGRPFMAVDDNGLDAANVRQLYRTRTRLDIEGNEREVRDPIVQNGDTQGRIVVLYDYDMLGNRIREASMEAGERWMLNDVAGKPIRAWNSRGHTARTAYDPLRRPVRSFVAGLNPANAAQETLTERIIYGEQHPQDELRNLRGRVYMHIDQAGAVTSETHDFKGNPLQTSRRLAREYKQVLDWSAADAAVPGNATAKLNPAGLEAALAPALEADTFATRTTFDALNRPTTLQTHDNSLVRPAYNEANLLERVEANLRGTTANGQPVWTPFVTNVDYNARGQRARIDYGNGVSTLYEYDPFTFRLVRMHTERNAAAFPGDCPQPPPAGWPGCGVQDLRYTYDPVGNITHIRDHAQQTIYFRNRRVEPSAEYSYDALYQLIRATGREHLGQTGGVRNPPTHPNAFNSFHSRLDHPNDGNALGSYTEQYVYDAVGNFLSMQHQGTDPAHPGWTRGYVYNEASLLEPLKKSNRLTSTAVGGTNPPVERYLYDAHGNIVRMPHLANHPNPATPNMHWDYKDQLHQVELSGAGSAYYVYDAAGQRTRKVWEKSPGLVEERIYLNGFEIFRRRNGAGTVTLERNTLHIMDDKQRVALVEMRTIDTAGSDPAPAQLIRYQFSNHLGSASLEMDQQAQIISYEEYTPYGTTSYQAVRNQLDTPKRYRYTGKERDEETGLYYHGSRYYAAWLGRWTSSDPAGLVDGPNLYRYTRNNPLTYTDPQGTDPQGATQPSPDRPIDLGPLQVSNISGSVSIRHAEIRAHLNNINSFWDLFSSNPSITIDSASISGGTLHLRSDLLLPSFGLSGYGSYQLDLSRFSIEHQIASAEIDGRAVMRTGPFSLHLGVSGYGSTTIPAEITPNEAREQLQSSMDQFRGWVGINGRLDINNLAVGAFSLSGDLGPGAQGNLQIRGTFGIPSLGSGSATVLGHISGTASFTGSQYNLSGSFNAGLLPLPVFATGTWSLDPTSGFQVQGHYVGPQFGPIGLNVGINPTGNVSDDTSALRAMDAMAPSAAGLGGITSMFEPGPSFGYSYFRYGQGNTTLFNVGVSPTSSSVPYFPGGLSQPLGAPSMGPYAGFRFRATF